MFIFLWVSLLITEEKNYKTHVQFTQVNIQASVARIIFARFFGVFSTSFNKILLDAEIKEYNKKLSTTIPNAYHTPQYNGKKHLLHHNYTIFHNNHPLSLVPRNYRNTQVTEHISTSHSYPQSPVTHIVDQQSNKEDTN